MDKNHDAIIMVRLNHGDTHLENRSLGLMRV